MVAAGLRGKNIKKLLAKANAQNRAKHIEVLEKPYDQVRRHEVRRIVVI